MNLASPISELTPGGIAPPRDAAARRDFSAAHFTHLFPAPFMTFVWPDGVELNEQLRPLILEQASGSQGLQRSNVGGWHSEIGGLEFCGEAGQRLVRHMYEMVDEATRRTLAELPARRGEPPRWTIRWVLHAWANVNRPGDFTQYHAHPGSTWSGRLLRGRWRAGRTRWRSPPPFVRSMPGPHQCFLAADRAGQAIHSPRARFDGAVPKLRSAHGVPTSRETATHFDRLQFTQGAFPLRKRLRRRHSWTGP